MGGRERGDVRSQRLSVWMDEGESLLPSWENPVVSPELGSPRTLPCPASLSAPLSFACPSGRGGIRSESQGARHISSEALVKATCWSHTEGFQRYTSVCAGVRREGGNQVSPEAVSQVNQPWEANSINTGKVVLSPSQLLWFIFPKCPPGPDSYGG